MDFLVIDFETANSKRNSACAIGVAHVKGGKIIESKSILIKPPGNDYDEMNIEIHGITPEMTENSPAFLDVMNNIINKYGNCPIVAHNASFDVSVLRAGYDLTFQPYPEREYYCTLILAKEAIPGLPNYKLPSVHKVCGGSSKEHHDPKDDAEACAEILISIGNKIEASSLYDVVFKYGITPGKLFNDSYTPCRGKITKISNESNAKKMSDYICNINADINGIFYDADVAFTGELASMTRSEAMQLIAGRGGRPKTVVSKLTEFVVVGEVDHEAFANGNPSNKLKKAISLLDAGNSIQVISEKEFLKLINKN